MKAPIVVEKLAAPAEAPLAGQTGGAHRFAPLGTEELTPAQKAWADLIAAPPRHGDFTKDPYRAFIRNADLAPKLIQLSDYLRWNTSLPPNVTEMAIMMTAREWTSQFEWASHYPLALKQGLDAELLDAIGSGSRPDKMTSDETALYDFVTALHRDKAVSDPLYTAALAAFGDSGIMDIIGIVGYYGLVSMTLITSQAQPPSNGVKRLEPLQP